MVPITPDGYFVARIDWREPWRLLTPMLIHFGILHLAFNMLWLYRLGSQVENVERSTRALLGLVVLTQVPGALVQFSVSGPLFGGMSGVVYGLFGFTWMQARYASKGYALTDQDTLWIMGWFVLCATGLVGHVANAQHALGLVFGLLAGIPAYVSFRRSSANLKFDEGSWADLNIRGFERFKRVYFDPYVPLWFVGLAVAVLFVARASVGSVPSVQVSVVVLAVTRCPPYRAFGACRRACPRRSGSAAPVDLRTPRTIRRNVDEAPP